MKRRRTNFFIISAPSGAGKTTLVEMLVREFTQLLFSISHTTRPPREGETDGVEYFFTTPEKFQAMREENKFLEWAQVHNHLYGTSRRMLEMAEEQGRDLLLDIDVQGAAKVKAQLPSALGIFILPPSLEALRERLIQRKQDSVEEIFQRMETARKEIRHYREYEYIVINDDLTQAYQSLSGIIRSQSCKTANLEDRIQSILKSFNIFDF